MYNITANDGDIAHGVKEFACDTVEDLKSLPECSMGSTAIIIATAEVYMMGSEKEWVKL
jgi:hypothetical protein